MNPRAIFALAAGALVLWAPLAVAGPGQAPTDAPPMLTINHLQKYDEDAPVFYVDWDGKLWQETNLQDGLQRRGTLDDAANFIPADDAPLLP